MANKTKAAQPTIDVSLDNLIDVNERQRLNVFNYLMQRVGEDRAKAARAQEQDFDWNAFKEAFRQAHGEKSYEELMSVIIRSYGLKTYKQVKQARSNQINALKRRMGRRAADLAS